MAKNSYYSKSPQLISTKPHLPKAIILTFVFFVLILNRVSAFDLGSWNILHLKYNQTSRLSFFGEAQVRSLLFYKHFHYHEFKGGVNYKVFPYLTLSIAAGDYDTYKEGGNFVYPKNNDEFRLWTQAILSQNIGKKLKIEQRYRVESRFTYSGYRNRFRYRLGASYPFGHEKNGFKPFQISANNEIFFTDKEPYFERNRISVSLSYKITGQLTWQLGYLHQFDYKINDESGRDFLMLGFAVELDRKNNRKTATEIEMID